MEAKDAVGEFFDAYYTDEKLDDIYTKLRIVE